MGQEVIVADHVISVSDVRDITVTSSLLIFLTKLNINIETSK
jgi:hypothetical protein